MTSTSAAKRYGLQNALDHQMNEARKRAKLRSTSERDEARDPE